MGLLFHGCPIVRVHFDLQTLGLYLYCHVDWRSVHTPRFALRATAVLYMRFCEIVYMMRWAWMQFAMYWHWNCTLQSHRIGMEPIHVWHHTQVCIAHRVNRTIVINNHSIQFLYLKNRSGTSHHVSEPREAEQRPKQIYTPLLWAKISFHPKENNTLVMQMGLKRRNPQSYFMSLLPLEMLPFWPIYLLVVTWKLIPSRAHWGNPRLVPGNVYPLGSREVFVYWH